MNGQEMAGGVFHLWLIIGFLCSLAVSSQSNHPTCPDCTDALRNCSVAECYACNHVPASCTVDTENGSISCDIVTNSCSIQTCGDCYHCTAVIAPTEGSEGEWRFNSHCFKHRCVSNFLDEETICARRGFTSTCSLRQVSNYLKCSCFGQNCTRPDMLTMYIDPPSPPPPSSSLSSSPIPATLVASISATNAAKTLVPTVSMSPDATHSSDVIVSGWVIAIIIISVLILLIVLASSSLFILHCARTKWERSQRQRQTNAIGLQNLTNEHDLPFQLVHLISRGRFGLVYRTHYQGELVAVKIFSYQNRQTWENERTIFAMESTKHRNILEYIVSGSWGSGYQIQMFVVTPYYPLGSLNGFLARNTLSWEQACRVIYSVMSGLEHLHSESYKNSGAVVMEKYSMAHRDIKSANVLVRGENGDSVIADFGLALILDPASDARDMANTGQVGTHRYMAPEVLDARVNLHDIESFKQIDMYALALVIWEVLWRCNVLEEKQPRAYIMPFEDLVGKCPSLDTMRELVCTQKIRPQIISLWRNHKGMNSLLETVEECWDEDPEARLSSANVVLRVREVIDGGSTAIVSHARPNRAPTHFPSVSPVDPCIRRCNVQESTADTTDSRPPPYDARWGYATTDRSATFESSQSQSRARLQSSMPHIQADEGYNSGRYEATPRSARSLRHSAVCEGIDPFLKFERRSGSLGRHRSNPGDIAEPMGQLSSTSMTSSSSSNIAHAAVTHTVSEPLGEAYHHRTTPVAPNDPHTPPLAFHNLSRSSESSQYPTSRETSPERVYTVGELSTTEP